MTDLLDVMLCVLLLFRQKVCFQPCSKCIFFYSCLPQSFLRTFFLLNGILKPDFKASKVQSCPVVAPLPSSNGGEGGTICPFEIRHFDILSVLYLQQMLLKLTAFSSHLEVPLLEVFLRTQPWWALSLDTWYEGIFYNLIMLCKFYSKSASEKSIFEMQ